MFRKVMISFKILLLLTGIIVAQPTWLTNLNLQSESSNIVLSFGGSTDATDGYDVGLDSLAPPAPPSDYYAYFQISNTNFTSLSQDIRAWASPYDTNINWTLVVTNADGIQTTLSWNPNELPAEGNFIILIGTDSYDMRTNSSVTFSGNEILTIQYKLFITQQITIQPNKLNLISFYVTPENLDASALFDSLTNFVVAFNDNGKYRIPPDIVYPGHPGTNTIGDIEPCEGYSIFISGDTPQTLSVTGLPIDASSLVCTVDNGKLNKIAFPKQNTQPIADVFNATANPDLWPHFVIAFDDEGQYFIPPDIVFPGHPGTNSIGDMIPGKGYSLFHNGDSPITYTFPESAGSPPLAKANAKKENSFSEPDHFTFVKTGEPHAVFLRNKGLILEEGDELAVFSGDNCVGAMKYGGSLSDPLVIWRAVEEYDLSGIKQGDKLTLRHWIRKTNEIEEVFIEGDIYFDKDRPFSLLNLTGSTIFEGINKLSDNIPERMALYQNYPNPFNPSTIIRFDINKPCNVSLVVYNVNGQVVSTLVDKFMSKGEYSVMWNGKTDNGNRVGSGVYLVHLRAGKYSFTRKVLLVD